MRLRALLVMCTFILIAGLAGCAPSSYRESSGSTAANAYVPPPPVPEPTWSPWYKLDDGALNGIEFSHMNDCPPGGATICNHRYRFNSNYETPVTIEYGIAWESATGFQKKSEQITLKPGENRSDLFVLTGKGLDEATVRLIADSNVLADARNTVAETRAAEQREAEQKRQQAELVARLAVEEQRRQEESRRQKQAAEAEYWRQHPEEYQARLAQIRYQEEEKERRERRREELEELRQQQAQEERRQARRDAEESSRQQAQLEEDGRRQMNDALTAGLQSFQNSVNQGLNTYNRAAQMNRDADNYIRQQKEDQAREAREVQRRRAEDAATQRRDAEERRRLQQQREQDQRNRELLALERSQKDETDRRQRQEEQQKQAQQRESQSAQEDTSAPKGGVPGEDACVLVTRNDKGEPVIKNICSYQISVWECSQGHEGLWTYEPGEKQTVYNVTGNISIAACKGATGIVPYIPNTKTLVSGTCNTSLGRFNAPSYVCRAP